MAHAHHFLYTWSYKNTLTISNTFYFFTASFVAQMRLNVTLYLHGLSCSHYHPYIFYCTRCMDTYRGKIIHVIMRILIYSSFFALNLILLTSRPNFVEVFHTVRKVEEAWIRVSQDHSTNKNPKLINRSYNFWNCVSWRAKVMSLTQIAKVWGSLGAGKQRLL